MPVKPDKVLFRNVSILDSTGADPYPGDVLVENDRIAAVGTVDEQAAAGARVIDGRGRTLMSGLCDAHTHFSWNNSADLDGLGTMPVEEHLLFCLESARTYIDSGYTMCLGAPVPRTASTSSAATPSTPGASPARATWPTARRSRSPAA